MISIKTLEEIKIMKEGGRILAGVMEKLQKEVRPGITTKELDGLAEALILSSGAKLAFKGYRGFPAAICVSVNEEIVHAIPSARKLEEGNIVTLDIGLIWKGFYADMAKTFPVGKISSERTRLIKVTKKALELGIKEVKPGNTFGDIGNVVQRYAEEQGFNVVRELCGHGIGKNLHEDPQIPNYGKKGTGPKIKEGMVFCIEPMVTIGDWHLAKSKDGQSFLTADGSTSAHFEHTVVVTKEGHKVLTLA